MATDEQLTKTSSRLDFVNNCLNVRTRPGSYPFADPENKAVQEYLLSVRRQICGALLGRLRKGQRDGDLPKAAPISALASYYATVLHGLALQSRDRVPRKALTHIAQIAMASWLQLASDVT